MAQRHKVKLYVEWLTEDDRYFSEMLEWSFIDARPGAPFSTRDESRWLPEHVALEESPGGLLLHWSGRRRAAPLDPEERAACFWRFLTLHDGNPDPIAAYARHYGVLDFCAHVWPGSLLARPAFRPCAACHADSRRPHHWQGSEPVAGWTVYARQLRAAVIAVASERKGESDKLPSDVRELLPGFPEGERSAGQAAATIAHTWLADATGNVAPDSPGRSITGVFHTVLWRENAKSVEHRIITTSLYALLALELATVLSRPEGIRVCPICFDPWRPPKPRDDRASPCTKPSCKEEHRRRYERARWHRRTRDAAAKPLQKGVDTGRQR
jgi:hypothetical protein